MAVISADALHQLHTLAGLIHAPNAEDGKNKWTRFYALSYANEALTFSAADDHIVVSRRIDTREGGGVPWTAFIPTWNFGPLAEYAAGASYRFDPTLSDRVVVVRREGALFRYCLFPTPEHIVFPGINVGEPGVSDSSVSWENPPTTVYFEVKYGSDLSKQTAGDDGSHGYPSDQLIRNIRVGLRECGWFRHEELFPANASVSTTLAKHRVRGMDGRERPSTDEGLSLQPRPRRSGGRSGTGVPASRPA
jgi:hypothetical protein